MVALENSRGAIQIVLSVEDDRVDPVTRLNFHKNFVFSIESLRKYLITADNVQES